MAQQMVNGSHYDGSVTVTNRMSRDYAVVNPSLMGKHMKPQDPVSIARRRIHWRLRRLGYSPDTINGRR